MVGHFVLFKNVEKIQSSHLLSMGIFEKLDRQIRNCALGWISGTKKNVTSNLKWFTKNNIISKNVQVKYGSDFL